MASLVVDDARAEENPEVPIATSRADSPSSPSAIRAYAEAAKVARIANPYYEVTRALGCVGADPLGERFSCLDDLWPALRSAERRQPELRPFLAVVAAEAKAEPKLFEFTLRAICRKLFGYGVPHPRLIEELERRRASGRVSGVVEIGAGTGYWAWLLTQTGIPTLAYDNGSWKLVPLWYDVQRGGVRQLVEVEPETADTLLLVWPPYNTSLARRALSAFRGSTLVYCGEGEGGCTADDKFFTMLERNWECVYTAPLAQWCGLHDATRIYERADP